MTKEDQKYNNLDEIIAAAEMGDEDAINMLSNIAANAAVSKNNETYAKANAALSRIDAERTASKQE